MLSRHPLYFASEDTMNNQPVPQVYMVQSFTTIALLLSATVCSSTISLVIEHCNLAPATPKSFYYNRISFFSSIDYSSIVKSNMQRTMVDYFEDADVSLIILFLKW